MGDILEIYGTSYDHKRRKELQTVLSKLYEEDSKSDNIKKKRPAYTQAELGKKINVDQTTISRLLSNYVIDWSDEYKIKLAQKNETTEDSNEIPIAKLTKHITITKPSVFFISVGPNRRKKLEEFLLKYYCSSKNKLGIIHIINTKNPSGLLVFTDDHNLEHHLYDDEYMQQIKIDA